MTNESVIYENFAKVAEWIKKEFPHAIEASYDRTIEIGGVHHVYHKSGLEIKNGVVYYVRGSWGWSSADALYNSDTNEWTDRDGNYRKYNVRPLELEEYLHEWPEQKLYVSGHLRPFETMYNFNV